ncbi:MAG: hypothetical protein SH868_12740, partial [Bythopirellula sp.]|nr:hypothetical protein [Bythopirellula sp.]
MLHNSTARAIVSNLTVAIGIAVAWAIVCSVGHQLVMGLFGGDTLATESLHIAQDGTVMIVSMNSGSYNEGLRTYRTLDGQEVKLADEESSLYTSTLPLPPPPPALANTTIDWKQRIGATTDYGNPATYWFVVRDTSLDGRAYLVGYDSTTKLPIGYLDRDGFQQTFPRASNLFNLQGHFSDYTPPFQAGTGYMEQPNVYPNFRSIRAGAEVFPPLWILFLLDEDHIWRVDSENVPPLVEKPVPPTFTISRGLLLGVNG